MSGLLTVPLILSLSKDARRITVGWFDRLTMSGLLTVPLILSLSKDAPPDYGILNRCWHL